jgi:His/Glu/Gln/Arg/opine family amino acid ABC transporter permease subunit
VTPSIIASAVGLTLLLFVSSYLMAAVLGVGVGALRLSNNAVLRAAGAAWIAFFRGIPSLVWLFIIFFGVSISGDRLTAVSAAAVTFGLVLQSRLWCVSACFVVPVPGAVLVFPSPG